MSNSGDLDRLTKRLNASCEFTIRDRVALKNLIATRDNYRNDALAYLNTISEADEDVHYLRRKLAVALWIVNEYVDEPMSKESEDIVGIWLSDMRSIGIEPSVE